MSLCLMYITNNPQVAQIAQSSGIQRIFVDMEYIGKEERQKGMDTVKSFHTIEDIINIKKVTQNGTSELLVRVNPIHDATKDYCSSEEEIENAISAGADVIMLPMFKTVNEVDRFLNCVNGRTETILLLENKEAVKNVKEILNNGGFDILHIGLNDLHLSMGKRFIFEPLIDGTVENLVNIIKNYNIPYGFGGIARIGYGMLPAEYIIAEHYRLGSTSAILSRSFCDANKSQNIEELESIFKKGVADIRNFEKTVSNFSVQQFTDNKIKTKEIVNNIIRERT